MSRCTALLLLLAMVGCDDDGGASADASPDAERRIADAAGPDAADPDAAPPDDAAADAAPGADAAPEPDLGVSLADCEAACAVYARCENLEPFGDEQGCIDACRRASRDGAPRAWFECLETVDCAELDLGACPPPEPDALACETACAAAADCEVPLPFPDCERACRSAGLLECAELLTGGQCDGPAFRGCLGERVFPACGATCARATECNIVRRDDCLGACLEAAGAGDPLHQERLRERRACVDGAASCFEVNACVDPDAQQGLGHTCAESCAVLDECGLANPGCVDECEAQLQVNPGGQQLLIDCVVEFLARAQCAPDAFMECFGGGLQLPQGDPPCTALCEAEDLCGVGEQPRAACEQACNNALLDPVAAERWRPRLPCGRVARCPDLEACLAEVDPEALCAEHCGALEACDRAGDDCPVRCAADFFRDRAAAERACAVGAADCDALADCSPPPPPSRCVDHCARLTACMGLALAGHADEAACVAACDDADLADPALPEALHACTLTAPACAAADPFTPGHFVTSCLFDVAATSPPDALACLRFCEARACADPDVELDGCARACGAGFVGEAVLRFAQAAPCLEAIEGAPSCAALTACVPDALEVDCAGACAEVSDCALEDPGCVARCEAAEAPEEAACLVAAARDGTCADVAACVGIEIPEPDPVCAEVCAAQIECGADDDPVRCGLACSPAAPVVDARAGCASAALCADVPACAAIEAAEDDRCAAVCAAAVACEAALDAEACARRCAGVLEAPRVGPEWLAGVTACVDAAVEGACADPVADCFAPPSPCRRSCQLVVDCQAGLFPPADVDACLALLCPEGRPNALGANVVRCALQTLDPLCDDDAYSECALGVP